MMNERTALLLADIDAFLRSSGMGESYFGKAAVGNSELVKRLRAGGRVWPETEDRLRDFMSSYSPAARAQPAPEKRAS